MGDGNQLLSSRTLPPRKPGNWLLGEMGQAERFSSTRFFRFLGAVHLLDWIFRSTVRDSLGPNSNSVPLAARRVAVAVSWSCHPIKSEAATTRYFPGRTPVAKRYAPV
jgi:hypothetical protein